ncbi:monocarboxylate transporter 12-like isoform X2 [Palaemon carinicauda]|uniref:monocarboxylate transporter 12-like isoform X2 n=1 Tax=Palaemon carinicauda TaxID=392227 RepID=UPI0035B5AA51
MTNSRGEDQSHLLGRQDSVPGVRKGRDGGSVDCRALGIVGKAAARKQTSHNSGSHTVDSSVSQVSLVQSNSLNSANIFGMERDSDIIPSTNSVNLLKYRKTDDDSGKQNMANEIEGVNESETSNSVPVAGTDEETKEQSENSNDNPNSKQCQNEDTKTENERITKTPDINKEIENPDQREVNRVKEEKHEVDQIRKRDNEEIVVKTVPPDGGWGWVVLVGSFVVMVCSSIGPCFSLIFSPLFVNLGTPPYTISWIFNSFSLIWNLMSPAVGPLTEEFGHRSVATVGAVLVTVGLMLSAFAPSSWFLFISFSVLGGIGLGILVTISNIIIPVYFTAHLGRANGILMTGTSIGIFVLPLLITHLQQLYTYRGATLILGAILFNTCVAAAVFHPVRWHSKTVKCQRRYSIRDIQLRRKSRAEAENRNLLPDSRENPVAVVETTPQKEKRKAPVALCCLLLRVIKSTLLSLRILCSPPAFIIALSGTLTMNGYLNFIIMVPFVVKKIHSVQGSALCISVAGISNLISRLIMSALADCKWFDIRIGYIVSISIIALINIAFPFITSLVWMAVSMGVWGYGIGSFMGLYNLVMIKYMGAKNLPAMFGACSLLNGLGFISIGSMLGWVTQIVGSYNVSIWALACLQCFCIVLWLLMPAAVAWQIRNLVPATTMSV